MGVTTDIAVYDHLRSTDTDDAVYWSFRTVLASLATNPLPSLLALALFLAGWFGEGLLPVPDWAFGVLTMAGITGLASVGSGRL